MDNLTFTTRVIDNLEWQVDLPEPMPWNHAVEYARMMDKAWGGGWRLPTVPELVSLFDYDEDFCPAFPDDEEWFWAASRAPRGPWAVNLGDGNNYAVGDQSDRNHVRLVRTIKEQTP